MPEPAAFRLAEIAARFGGVLEGDASVLVSQVGSLALATPGQIAFLVNPAYRHQLSTTKASAVILPPQFAAQTSLPKIVHHNAYACYARVAALLNPQHLGKCGAHPSAVLASTVPASARIGAQVVIGEHVTLGENVTLYPGCVLGDEVVIGENSVLYPNVVVHRRCVIGRRAIIQAGAVIGSDGFGFAKEGECWVKIPQIGRVIIGDDVEIGANTSIDRGALDDTVLGNGVKLDNQIQIAHNVVIGDHTAMAGCVGVAGSTRIGRRCTIGGAGMVTGHLNIGDDVHISAGTLVSKDLPQPGLYTGIFPLDTHAVWRRNAVQIKRLEKLAKRIDELEKKLECREQTS